MSELDDIATLAESAAKEAGAMLLSGYRSGVRVREKAPRDLVTEYDLRSEALLRERLREAGIAILGEEQGGEIAERTLVVDPLDGTTNFAHGHPFFCVSIGLVDRGTPIMGVVFAPVLNTCWRAVRGGGTTRNGEACNVSEVTALDHALISTGFAADRKGIDFSAYIRVKMRAQAMRRCGSAALDLCLVADGTYDGYWESKLRAWDIAAGACLVQEAGGRLTDSKGGPFDVFTGNVCATNGHLHQQLVNELG